MLRRVFQLYTCWFQFRHPIRVHRVACSRFTYSFCCRDCEVVDGSHREAQCAADRDEAELDEGIRLGRETCTLPGADAAPTVDNIDEGWEEDTSHPRYIAQEIMVRVHSRIELWDKAMHTDPKFPGDFGDSKSVTAARKVTGLALHKRVVSVVSKDVHDDTHIIEFASLLGITIGPSHLNGSLVSRCVYERARLSAGLCAPVAAQLLVECCGTPLP